MRHSRTVREENNKLHTKLHCLEKPKSVPSPHLVSYEHVALHSREALEAQRSPCSRRLGSASSWTFAGRQRLSFSSTLPVSMPYLVHVLCREYPDDADWSCDAEDGFEATLYHFCRASEMECRPRTMNEVSIGWSEPNWYSIVARRAWLLTWQKSR
jgi:hypothetical protein